MQVDKQHDICRICHLSEEEEQDPFVSPCDCRGTMKYVHRFCLNEWRMRSKNSRSIDKCEQCFGSYRISEHKYQIFLHPIAIHCKAVLIFVSLFLSCFAVIYKIDAVRIDTYLEDMSLSDVFDLGLFLEPSEIVVYALIVMSLVYYLFASANPLMVFYIGFVVWRYIYFGRMIDTWLLCGTLMYSMLQIYFYVHEQTKETISYYIKWQLLKEYKKKL